MVGETPAAGCTFDSSGSFELAQGDTEGVVAYPQRGAQGLAREGAARAVQAGEDARLQIRSAGEGGGLGFGVTLDDEMRSRR